MKISIIGPSGSGKTTVAKKFSNSLGLEHTNLDYVFYKHEQEKSRIEFPETEWRKQLSSILNRDRWIIEGVNPIKEVFDKADIIIYVKPSFATALFRQWKRYFTDPTQRKEHGFINNIKLSGYLYKQYFEAEDPTKLNDPMYSRVKKIDRILSSYTNKVAVIKTKRDLEELLQEVLKTPREVLA